MINNNLRPIVRLILSLTVGAVGIGAVALHAQVTRQEMAGVRNLTLVAPTVACAGATDASAIPAIAQKGYKAIINLRLASESGAAVDEARAAADLAGIRYIHLPFNLAKPDEAVVDQFIAAVSDESNLPVFVHCASANRVAGLWLIKRVVVDGWDQAKAESEARAIGLSSPAMRDFALAQIARRKG